MKVVAKKEFIPRYGVRGGNILFKENEIYDAEFTPIVYDPNTLQPIKGGIIIKLSKGWIKETMDNFYTLEEYRENKLKDILE